ncbi:MAG: hypothetical protein ACLU38_03420 [Dysosmobacter sp.]
MTHFDDDHINGVEHLLARMGAVDPDDPESGGRRGAGPAAGTGGAVRHGRGDCDRGDRICPLGMEN